MGEFYNSPHLAMVSVDNFSTHYYTLLLLRDTVKPQSHQIYMLCNMFNKKLRLLHNIA